ncbi:MAG TPA: ABC transporter permease [Candidatus Polarisedimenticolia bacterium]|nr:ABC transporter permease [Candidatus Polarisedimenticolia bacterium]
MKERPSFSMRCYRALLRLLPFEFRGDFGGEMEAVFHKQHADAERGRGGGLAKLWWETIVGIFTTAPREHLAILRQDAGFALRMMRRNPGFTLASIVTLALGIGATTAIFSVVHAVLLKPLPYAHGESLVVLSQEAPPSSVSTTAFSVPEMMDLRSRNRSLDGLVEYHNMSFILLGRAEPERVETGVVSWNYFDLFGVKPLLGRDFRSEDEKDGAPAVLLLGYEYWQRSFGGDPTVVGKDFKMNDKIHTVVGVLPPFPQYPDRNDVYMPSTACPFRSNPSLVTNRNGRMVALFGRLKSGTAVAQAQADLTTVVASLQREHPDSYPAGSHAAARTVPLRTQLTQAAKPTMLILLMAAGFVLIIACASVANLNLARMARRDRELALRAAMGAGRARLFRQLLTESCILSLAGGAVGWLLAIGMMEMLTRLAGRFTARASEIRMDEPILLFTIALAFLTSLVSGSAPALAGRGNLSGSLKEGGGIQSTLGASRRRGQNLLIVAQFAVSFVLLIGAGLMLRTLLNLQRVDPGFRPENVLTMDIYLDFAKYTDGPKRGNFFQSLLEKVQAQPQVISAAVSLSVPLDQSVQASSFQIEGQPEEAGREAPRADIHVVSADYFETLHIPVVQGRTFELRDSADAAGVVVVNRALARHRWPGGDAVGRRISLNQGRTWRSVVGIVGDTKENGLNQPWRDGIYLPLAQSPLLQGNLVVRTRNDPMDIARIVVQRLYEVDPNQPAGRIRSLDTVRADSIAAPSLTARLLGIFALVALLIAGTGIGGVIALAVSQRTHEFGVRLAVGARPRDILGMVLAQGLKLALLGTGFGLLGAVAVTRVLRGLLFEVAPTDPLVFALVILVLSLAAILACFFPARRASSVDPMIALHVE